MQLDPSITFNESGDALGDEITVDIATRIQAPGLERRWSRFRVPAMVGCQRILDD